MRIHEFKRVAPSFLNESIMSIMNDSLGNHWRISNNLFNTVTCIHCNKDLCLTDWQLASMPFVGGRMNVEHARKDLVLCDKGVKVPWYIALAAYFFGWNFDLRPRF